MKLLARTALISALVLCACVALPRRGQLTMRDVQFPLKDRTLSSGLRILVEEDHTEPLVAVVTLIGSGGTADPKGKEGLAHFVEHLAFRARHGGGPNVWNRLEQVGVGTISAFTSLDYTVYYAVGPKEILPELLALHGKLVTQPVVGVEPAIFEVEREVVRSELRQRVETGWVSQAFSLTQAAVFPQGHPYHRPVIGTHDSLSAITPDDVRAFTQNHYRPDNATMVIIGNVDLTTIDPVLEKNLPRSVFSSVRNIPNRLAAEATEPPLREKQPWTVNRGQVLTPEVWIGWSLPRGFDSDSHLMQFAVRNAQGHFWKAYQEDRDIMGIQMELIPGREASLLFCRIALAEGKNPQRSAEHVLDQLYKVWGSSHDSTDSALDNTSGDILFAQRRLRGVVDMLEEGQELTNRALFRAETTHFYKDPGAYTRALGAMARAARPQLQEFAMKYMNRERARMIYLAPNEANTEPPAMATGLGVEASDEVASTAAQAPAALKNRQAPQRFSKSTWKVLPNGLEVIVLPRQSLPLVTVGIEFRGGIAGASPRGVGEVTDWLGYPASRVWGDPGEVGGSGRGWYGDDALRYQFQGASGNLPNLLAMSYEWITSIKVNEWVLREFKHESVPMWKVLETRPDLVADREFKAALFGPEHPYGQKALSSDFARVEFGQIDPWVRAKHDPSNAILTIVGDVKPPEALALVEQWFGGWKSSKPAPSAAPTPRERRDALRGTASELDALTLTRKGATLVTHKPGSTQAVLRIGCVLPSLDPAVRVRHELLASVLATRLNTALREQMGASYGIHGGAEFYRGGLTRLEVSGAVDGARLDRAMQVIRTTLAEFSEQGVPQPLLERARWHLTRNREVRFQTNEATAAAILEVRKLDDGHIGDALQALDAYPKHLGQITAEQLREDVKECRSRLVTSAIGDEPRIQAALAATPAP